MSAWKPSTHQARPDTDLSKVPTAALLQEIGKRCGEKPRGGSKPAAKEMPFATKAEWAKDKANQARAKLVELRARPVDGMAAQWDQDQTAAELEGDVEKYDGMAAAFERKGQ